MQPSSILIALFGFICSAFAQLPPGLFTSGLAGLPSSGFTGFTGTQQQRVPTPGNGRSSTGMPPQGPVLFPSSPESRDSSGVIVGASGYGFIPPGVNALVQQQGRGVPSPFSSPFSQPFASSFFNFN